MMRLVLYVSSQSHQALVEDATRRGGASGLRVTPEVAARLALYRGLGFGADGKAGGGSAPSSPTPRPLAPRERVIVDNALRVIADRVGLARGVVGEDEMAADRYLSHIVDEVEKIRGALEMPGPTPIAGEVG